MPDLRKASPPTFLERLGILTVRPLGVKRQISLYGVLPNPGQSVNLAEDTVNEYVSGRACYVDFLNTSHVPITVVGRLKS